MGGRPEVDETYDQITAGLTLDWSRLGYVQMAKEFVELCSAVMVLADLSDMKSPARKILMFPKAWLVETDEEEYDPQMTTTRRLLRTAARRYGATLMPMDPIIDGADGEDTRNKVHLIRY